MGAIEEQQYHSKLKATIRTMGYGYLEIRGGYAEVDIKSSTEIIDEDSEFSLFIPRMSLKDALKIGATDHGWGPQDHILHSDRDSLALYSTNATKAPIGTITMEFSYEQNENVFPLVRKAVLEYYSSHIQSSHGDENFFLEELGLDRRWPEFPHQSKWHNWGIRVI